MHILNEKVSSLKNTSYDDHNKQYMVDSQIKVCSFDAVKEWYVKNKISNVSPNPKSIDALYFEKHESFFIEFKNGTIDNTVNFEINKKIYDSLFILFDLKYIDKNNRPVDSISYTRANMNYILVYNKEKFLEYKPTRQTTDGIKRQKEQIEELKKKEKRQESFHRTTLYKRVRNLANEELILFGLDQFKNYLFKNVYTYTIEEFQEKFVRKWENEQ